MTHDRFSAEALYDASNIDPYDFPKYTTQLLNLANQNSQATRPKVVGQMSELIQKADAQTFGEWRDWYLERHPDAIETAKQKVKSHIEKLKAAIEKIDEDMIEAWLEDLILVKTAEGLLIQQATLEHLSEQFDRAYSVAPAEDEAKGIDGYLGETPVSIKPESYKQKTSVQHEEIGAATVFYKKTRKYIHIEYDEIAFT